MNNTEHLALNQPQYVDPADIMRINESMDIIDEWAAHTDDKVNELDDKKANSEGAKLTGNVTLNGNQIVTAQEILTSDKTVYVSKTGNDSAGDGSNSNPFLTIQKAVNYGMLFYSRTGSLIISVGPGTFNESIVFPNTNTVDFSLSGAGSDQTIISGVAENGITLTIYGSVRLDDLTIKLPPGVSSRGIYVGAFKAVLYIYSGVVVSGHSTSQLGTGVFVNTGRAYLGASTSGSPLELNNLSISVTSSNMGFIQCQNLSGANNGIAYQSGRSSIVVRSGTNPTAATLESKVGGQIFS